MAKKEVKAVPTVEATVTARLKKLQRESETSFYNGKVLPLLERWSNGNRDQSLVEEILLLKA